LVNLPKTFILSCLSLACEQKKTSHDIAVAWGCFVYGGCVKKKLNKKTFDFSYFNGGLDKTFDF